MQKLPLCTEDFLQKLTENDFYPDKWNLQRSFINLSQTSSGIYFSVGTIEIRNNIIDCVPHNVFILVYFFFLITVVWQGRVCIFMRKCMNLARYRWMTL